MSSPCYRPVTRRFVASAGAIVRGVTWIVIHGDFTSYNVIADGLPSRPVGIIDFQRAHVQAPVADIAAGLWRSGRPRDKRARAGHGDAGMLAEIRWISAHATAIADAAASALL